MSIFVAPNSQSSSARGNQKSKENTKWRRGRATVMVAERAPRDLGGCVRTASSYWPVRRSAGALMDDADGRIARGQDWQFGPSWRTRSPGMVSRMYESGGRGVPVPMDTQNANRARSQALGVPRAYAWDPEWRDGCRWAYGEGSRGKTLERRAEKTRCCCASTGLESEHSRERGTEAVEKP